MHAVEKRGSFWVIWLTWAQLAWKYCLHIPASQPIQIPVLKQGRLVTFTATYRVKNCLWMTDCWLIDWSGKLVSYPPGVFTVSTEDTGPSAPGLIVQLKQRGSRYPTRDFNRTNSLQMSAIGWLTDPEAEPDPAPNADPALFTSDLQDTNKK